VLQPLPGAGLAELIAQVTRGADKKHFSMVDRRDRIPGCFAALSI
jgi:hypothetical protein